jgi:MFS family permease
MISSNHVAVDMAWKTPQFWLLWGVLCMNVTAGIGVLGQASAMSQEIFPGRVTVVAAAGFVGLLSIFNMLGRFFWASTSDVIGRRNTYFCFFVLGIVLYALVPGTGEIGSVALFVACFVVILSMYGGGFATIPAYLRDLFGTRYVGAIHGMLITAWSVAGVLGPVLVNYIRQYQIDHGVAKAAAYNITMYIMAGLLLVGLLCNLLVKPVDARYHMQPDTDARGMPAQTRVQASATAAGSAPTPTSSLSVFLAWALVGVPLLWGVYETLLNAMKLFK